MCRDLVNNKKFILVSCLIITCIAITSIQSVSAASAHPKLILTSEGVEEIRQNLGKVPLFDKSLIKAQRAVDSEIKNGIETPIPFDYSGGYTHERHKRNFRIAQQAGALFQILQDEKYAIYVRDMLLQYEAMYKDLPIHPKERSYARGKLFWQCLNDANWLVFMSQAYDAIHDWLTESERQKLEANLFRPFADFISIENPQFYNRIHNHSTWGNAAVGMIGLVMDDEELIQRALYGIENDGLTETLKDNDGGFIKLPGSESGFLANLEEPFSPEGYYTEGPYYQRYAMYPFLMFAVAMQNARPKEKVLHHKDGVLFKAVHTLLNLTDADGEFFPLNDGQKGMSYHSGSLVSAVDLAYHYGEKNKQLLTIAKKQASVLLDQSGLSVAIDVRDKLSQEFKKNSVNFTDGPEGKQGGLAVLRSKQESLSLVFKYTAQGLSHGHYDKLSFSLYNQGDEVLQDYGLVRFVNIEQKGGGNYLKENKSWAKQSIAHNTVTVNEKSHFDGKYKIGSLHHSDLHFFDVKNEGVSVVSAIEENAYSGILMHRTMAIIQRENYEEPFVLDIYKVKSKKKNQYDLPFYYMGQLINTNVDYTTPESFKALGESNGYQHLFVEGKGRVDKNNARFTWLNKGKFYTLTSTTKTDDSLLLTRIGANDPDFNLRRDAALMIRRNNTKDTIFASAIEVHGSYSPVSELSQNSEGNIAALDIIVDTNNYTAISIGFNNGENGVFIVSNNNTTSDKKHALKILGKAYTWQGPYFFGDL